MKTPCLDRHYAKYQVGRTRHPNRVKRQKFPVSAARFREARFSAGLGVPACADLLRVSERTIRGWESGATRIPYTAYKLMRLLRGGKVLGPRWEGFYVRGDHLVTPEGHRFHFGELAWWSLLVRQARMFRELTKLNREKGHAPAEPALGLSLYSISDKAEVADGGQVAPAPLLGKAAGVLPASEASPAAIPPPGPRLPRRKGRNRLGNVLSAAGGAL